MYTLNLDSSVQIEIRKSLNLNLYHEISKTLGVENGWILGVKYFDNFKCYDCLDFNLFRGIKVLRSGGFRGGSVFSGICHM